MLSDINDEVIFSSFVNFEFREMISSIPANSAQNYTKKVMPNNPYSARIYVKVEDLQNFSERSEVSGCQISMIAGYEVLASYLEDIGRLMRMYKPSSADSLSADKIEDLIAAKTQTWCPGSIDAGIFQTIGYFRHLRNSYAHGHENASKKLLSFARGNASTLTGFWQNLRPNTLSFDFQKLPMRTINIDDARAGMNLMRIALRKIDEAIAASLGFSDVLPATVETVLATSPEVPSNKDKLARKVSGSLKNDFGDTNPISGVRRLIESYLASRL